ncbi:MAG: DoxX family protein [Candidatus Velthaea sp.]
MTARWLKPAARATLAMLLFTAGMFHLMRPEPFVRIVPPYLPHALWLVYISGVCEALGAVGLLLPRSRRIAAWALIALLAAVFPANVNMALHPEAFRDMAGTVALWLRLPLQIVLVAWAAWCGGLLHTHRAARARRE